ncbi:MAG: hypothetical protein V1867_05370 [Candidatus Falkowbacteria bacterium]
MANKKKFKLSAVIIIALVIFLIIFLFFRQNKITPPAPPILPAPPAAEISISTDKKIYGSGETINIIIKNGLEENVFYSPDGDRVWEMEYLEKSEWKKLGYGGHEGFQLTDEPLNNECYIALYEQVPPVALKTGAKINAAWDQKICPFNAGGFSEASVVRYIEGGEYRFAFQYGYSLYDNDMLIFEPEIIYSESFIIK